MLPKSVGLLLITIPDSVCNDVIFAITSVNLSYLQLLQWISGKGVRIYCHQAYGPVFGVAQWIKATLSLMSPLYPVSPNIAVFIFLMEASWCTAYVGSDTSDETSYIFCPVDSYLSFCNLPDPTPAKFQTWMNTKALGVNSQTLSVTWHVQVHVFYFLFCILWTIAMGKPTDFVIWCWCKPVASD